MERGKDSGKGNEGDAGTRLIVGIQPVREAIRARGPELDKVLIERSAGADAQLDALARFAADHGVVVQRVYRSEIEKLAKGAKHQGALAYAPQLNVVGLDALAIEPASLFIALDELQDPQNFGAIVRSAVALGASGVIWPEHRSAPLSAAMFRASAGAVEHALLCRVTALPSALMTLRASGVTVVGLDMNGERALEDVALDGPLCLVVGAEGKGLRKPVKQACDTLARLPMNGRLASLNASVAAAIALYEAGSQRRALARATASEAQAADVHADADAAEDSESVDDGDDDTEPPDAR